MATEPKEGKLIYHITALQNLDSILENGLCPRGSIDFDFVDIADEEILKSRSKFELANYTPFHFFCPTPFAGSVQLANKDSKFIYITLKRDFAEYNNFKVVPTHPLHYDEDPLEWKDGIKAINWDLMSQRDYESHLCKETCMAEAIFNGIIEAKLFKSFYVKDVETKTIVEEKLRKFNFINIWVNINENFFINND